MEKKWRILIPAAAAVLIVSAVGVSTRAEEADEQTIPDRIYIGEVSVGGMTEDEAKDAIEEYVDSLSEEEVTLTVGDNSVTVTAEELGLSCSGEEELISEALHYGSSGNLIARYKQQKDLENENKVYALALTVDEELTEALLEENRDELDAEAVDYGLVRENGSFTIVEGSSGYEIIVEDSIDVLNEAFSEGWEEGTSIELAAETVEPQGSEEELSKVQDVLGSYSTDFSSSSSGRAANVKNATSLIDGSVLYPGEEFSVYDAIAPMDAENGYELAGSYENGTTVETYGGGVCQVSTTLYNAVIRAELEVTERYPHSMTVSYVDPSCDAAIAGTYKNLKFVNDGDSPIYIEGYTSGGILYFTIYGEETRDENREVSFVSETTSTTEPDVEFETTSDPVGTVTQVQSSHTGKTAKLWKIVTVDGVEISREVFNTSTYKASNAIYEVGISSESEEAVEAMKEAIATGDLSKVKAAAAEWKNAKADDEEEEEEEEEEDDDSDSSSSKSSSSDSSSSKSSSSSDTDSTDSSDSSVSTESAESDTEE